MTDTAEQVRTVPARLPAAATSGAPAEAARILTELHRTAGSTDPFAEAVRATHMPMIVTDARLPDNPVVFANDAFCRLTGYAREEILGRNCRFLQGPETSAEAVGRIRAAVAAGERIDIDIRNHRKTGEPFWNRLQTTPVRDAAGAVAYFVASQLDVTLERVHLVGLENENAALVAELADRLRAHEASEAHLRMATEAADVGTWDWTPETDLLAWSDRTKAMFGFAPSAVCSLADFYACLHADDQLPTRAAFDAAIDPVLRAGYDVEYRVVDAASGTVRWVAARGRALFDGDRCLKAMGTAIDITQRKAAAARGAVLLGLTGSLRQLTDPAAIMVQAATALGRHLAADQVGFFRLSDDGRAAVLETGYHVGPAPLSRSDRLIAEAGGDPSRSWIGRLTILDDAAADSGPLGRLHDAMGLRALVSAPLIRGGRVRASLFVGSRSPRAWMPQDVALIEDVASLVWDAVERARAEEALRDLNATLEARVEERTAALLQAEDALRQAQKMEAVGQLTGGIAHDFNNLLTGIVGSLELLQRRVAEGRTEDLQRYADGAVRSANRAAALTQRLLAFARRQPLDPQPVAVNQLLIGMQELLAQTLGPSIALGVSLGTGVPSVLCDPNQLEGAILNLAINARDAMLPDGTAPDQAGEGAAPHGGGDAHGRLTISTAAVMLDEAFVRAQGDGMTAGAYALVSVTDTGRGMSQDVIDRAFEPFFTTKTLGHGTGLGLSMLYGFVRQSNGHVRIRSAPGLGSTFEVYLPRLAEETSLGGAA